MPHVDVAASRSYAAGARVGVLGLIVAASVFARVEQPMPLTAYEAVALNPDAFISTVERDLTWLYRLSVRAPGGSTSQPAPCTG